MNSYYDVVIVGAGPCGVTAANLLGGYGIETLIIDKADDILDIPRAIGICEEGSRITNAAGVYGQIRSHIRPIERVLFQNKQHENVFFTDISKPKHGYNILSMFYQPKLERLMRSALSRYPHVELQTGIELTGFTELDKTVDLQLTKEGDVHDIQCRYMLACDGASSTIRKALDIEYSGKTYPQDWLILDCENNPIKNQEVIFSIDPDRPAVTMPGPDDKRRWEFLVKRTDVPEELLSETGARKLLANWCDPDQVDIERKAIYTFHARTAKVFQSRNVFLLGDAAHITPPFAGQGMMAGLRDAYNLSWKVAAVLKQQVNPDILLSYSVERIPQCKQVIAFARWMGAIILPQNPLMARIRDGFFKLLRMLGVHSDEKGLQAKKIPNHINGSLIRNFFITRIWKTGFELPQHPLEKIGSHPKPADELLNDQFCILSWQLSAADFMSDGLQQRWIQLNGKQIVLTASKGTATKLHHYMDSQKNYASILRNGERVVVIRPDKMVIINCKPMQLEKQLNRYLNLTLPQVL